METVSKYLFSSIIYVTVSFIPKYLEAQLFGLVVKASALRVEDPGFEFHLHQDFSGVESYQLRPCITY